MSAETSVPLDPLADDRQSLDRARRGSPQALGQVLELCRRYLLHIANSELDSHLQAKLGASDVVQETFLEAQRIFDRFEGNSPDELRAWLLSTHGVGASLGLMHKTLARLGLTLKKSRSGPRSRTGPSLPPSAPCGAPDRAS